MIALFVAIFALAHIVSILLFYWWEVKDRNPSILAVLLLRVSLFRSPLNSMLRRPANVLYFPPTHRRRVCEQSRDADSHTGRRPDRRGRLRRPLPPRWPPRHDRAAPAIWPIAGRRLRPQQRL